MKTEQLTAQEMSLLTAFRSMTNHDREMAAVFCGCCVRNNPRLSKPSLRLVAAPTRQPKQ
ncbi:hypothetical protein BH11PSE11_BH11PSE11_12370 [soil metagenome]